MILLFYLALNLIVIVLFIKKKKRLNILEIIAYLMVSSYLYQNFSALCYMNFKTLLIPEKLSYEFTHFINRIVLFPILMVTFIDFLLALRTFRKKFLLFIGSVLFFVGLEWLADLLGVIIHVNWRLWWSFAFWMAALLFLIGFMKFFRKALYKEGVKL